VGTPNKLCDFDAAGAAGSAGGGCNEAIFSLSEDSKSTT